MVPLAVAGRWRMVTRPQARTRISCGEARGPQGAVSRYRRSRTTLFRFVEQSSNTRLENPRALK